MHFSIVEQVDQTCQLMLSSLDLCSSELPGLKELAATSLTEHISRLMRRVSGPHLPWPTLPILVCEAVSGSSHLAAARCVAAAWELGNLAATHIDAWQDQDTDDALWRRVGPWQTVNLALGLLSLSWQTLSKLVMDGVLPIATAHDLKWEFERTLMRMSEGQHADLGDDLDLDDYQAVATAKTGSLFRLACWSGAVVAGASDNVAEQYGAFGEALGLLIQAWNDLYGLEGTLGKRDEGHMRTLPVLASRALAEGGQTTTAPSALEHGGRLYALMQAALWHQQASDALARCPAPGRLGQFLDSYSVERVVLANETADG